MSDEKKLYGEVSQNVVGGIQKTIDVLNKCVDACLNNAGDTAFTLEARESFMKSGRSLKAEVDKIAKAKFAADTADFNELVKNYQALSDDVQQKLAKLQSMVEKLQTVSEILTAADMALQVAAGLAKSL